MAPTPFRRRRKATRIARNLALAEAALAMAKSRVGATGGAVKGGASKAGGAVKGRGRLLLAGTAVLVAGAVALLKRDKVAQVLPSRSGAEPVADAPPPPQQSNYDAPGPVANTATPIPVAPDPAVRPGTDAGESTPAGEPTPTRPAIDERAEEEAAAAEAAAIGGSAPEYAAGTLDEPLDEADRAVAEGGGGVAEGQEQAEAELEENATVRDQAPSDAERQIDDAIEAQDEPWTGETPEPVVPTDEPADADQGIVPGPGQEGGGISGRPGALLDDAAETNETPGVPATGSAATEPHTGDEEGEPGRSGDSG